MVSQVQSFWEVFFPRHLHSIVVCLGTSRGFPIFSLSFSKHSQELTSAINCGPGSGGGGTKEVAGLLIPSRGAGGRPATHRIETIGAGLTAGYLTHTVHTVQQPFLPSYCSACFQLLPASCHMCCGSIVAREAQPSPPLFPQPLRPRMLQDVTEGEQHAAKPLFCQFFFVLGLHL